MKNLLTFCLISLLFLFSKTNGQSGVMPFNDENKISFQGIVDIPQKDKTTLYKDTREYVLLNYINKDCPLVLDEVDNRIYVKGVINKVHFRKYYFPIFMKTYVYDVVYTLKIYFKDKRVRYEITDISIQRKLNTKVSGYNWGNGFTSASVKESEILKYDLEKLYAVKRYRTPFHKLFQQTDSRIKNEINRFTTYLNKTNKMNDW